MKRSSLIYIAAALASVTCLVHIIGIFVAVPPELTDVNATIATMEATMVPMPVGSARSYMQILNGNNFGTSLLLLVCAFQMFATAKLPSSQATNRTIIIATLGLAGFAIISAIYFFPIPAVFTGIAAGLGIIASTRQ